MRNKLPINTLGRKATLSQRASGACGLTLVELLVAISVLGFVAVLGWRGLDSIVRARISLTADLDQTRGMQLTFAQLQSDCAHMASQAVFPNRIPLVIEPGRISMVRSVYMDNQPSRLQVITYEVKDNILTRRESDATRDIKLLEAQLLNSSNANEPVVLQSDVESMSTRVWTSGGTSWVNGIRAISPAAANPLVSAGQIPAPSAAVIPLFPTGLEVTLRLRGYETGLLKVFLLGSV